MMDKAKAQELGPDSLCRAMEWCLCLQKVPLEGYRMLMLFEQSVIRASLRKVY